jgi:hypothetical protein
VPLVASGPDVAVFALGDQKIVRDELTLVASADGVTLSQEAFFLGYPLPWQLRLSGQPSSGQRCPSGRSSTM